MVVSTVKDTCDSVSISKPPALIETPLQRSCVLLVVKKSDRQWIALVMRVLRIDSIQPARAHAGTPEAGVVPGTFQEREIFPYAQFCKRAGSFDS